MDRALGQVLESMINTLPVGFSVTVGLTRTNSHYVVHAAVHTQEPEGRVVLYETGVEILDTARQLQARVLANEVWIGPDQLPEEVDGH